MQASLFSGFAASLLACCLTPGGRLSSLATGADSAAGPSASQRRADELVRLAQQSELAGDNQRRHVFLSLALHVRQDHALAHWLFGDVYLDGGYRSLQEAERFASEDESRNRYEQVRGQMSERFPNNLDAHLVMARWCRQNRCEMEERYHWYKCLEIAPQNAEALAGLGAVWYQGQLVSKAAWEQFSVQWRRGEGQRKVWRRKLHDWAERIEGPQTENGPEEALDRLRAVSDPEAIPVLCEMLAPRGERLGLELADVLDRMAVPDATLALAWLAAHSEHGSVRASAADRLCDKPFHEFVPPLLAIMQLPVDSSYDIEVTRVGAVSYEHTLSRKTAESEQRETLQRNFLQVEDNSLLPGQMIEDTFLVLPRPVREYHAQRQQNAARATANYQQAAKAVEERVDRFNSQVRQTNERVSGVLARVAGKDLGDSREAWFKWWDDYNEMDRPAEPSRATRYDADPEIYVFSPNIVRLSRDTGPPGYGGVPQYVGPVMGAYSLTGYTRSPVPGYGHVPGSRMSGYYSDPRVMVKRSCFVRGTLVRTREGLTPIERIQAGDLVLSQDVESGELTYRPVLSTTIRPPSAVRRIRVGDEVVTATAGHPFWVAGQGWRMAKFVQAGDLMTVLPAVGRFIDGRGWRAGSVQSGRWRLPLLFRRRHGLLVHDNELRQPTRAILPGYAP